ncbi:MAG: type I methionyl aminopeptidase [Pirellulaceae bacterium]|jgi:methionyl aminopeptidase|nr:type I methionyl aminopeptidase [Pirellulaceae bacterium]MDP7015349.1 type I methionyl aminopeptidase [Pirellulaceae bacterium]
MSKKGRIPRRAKRPTANRLLSLQLTPGEQDAMRAACRFNSQLLDRIRPHIKAGVKTIEIDELVHQYTIDHGHRPATLGYRGFPKSCCTSVNEVICHGIPGDYALIEGDIINVDLTSIVEGWYGDQSETFLIGDVSDHARAVTQCSFDCLHLGIAAVRAGGRLSDIGEAITTEAHNRGFSVVEEYVGHGVGNQFHKDPSVSHVPTEEGYQTILPAGICFTIEPMINVGTQETELDRRDKWTVRTADRNLSSQFEHTVLTTEDGAEILTTTEHGPQQGHCF